MSQHKPELVIDTQGHSGIVNGLIVNPEGDKLISVSEDKTIRIWDLANGDLIRTLRTQAETGFLGRIYAAALSPDGRFLAIAGYFKNNEIRIIDLFKRSDLAILEGHENIITKLRFTNDGTKLASASADKTARVWNIKYLDGKIYGELDKILSGHQGQVYDIAFSPNGGKLVSSSYDGSLRLWNLGADNPTGISMKMHVDKVYSTAFSPDGRFIVSGGNKGKVLVWTHEGNYKASLDSFDEPITHLSFTKSGKLVVAGSEVYLYDVESQSLVKKLATTDNFITGLDAYGEEYLITSGSLQGNIEVRSFETGQLVGQMQGKTNTPCAVGISANNQVVFGSNSGNGCKLDAAFDLSNLKYLWDNFNAEDFEGSYTSEGGYKLIKTDEYTLSTGFSGSVKNDPRVDGRLKSYTIVDEQRIAVGGDFSLKMYSRNGEFVREYLGHNGQVTDIVASKDKKYLISSHGDQTIRVWNLETGENLVSLLTTTDNEWISWTPAGYYSASAGGEKYLGWFIARGMDKMADYYPSNVYKTKYLLPEVIKKTLTLGSFEQAKNYLDIKDKTAITEDLDINNAAPVIEWLSPEIIETETNQASLVIKANIHSSSKIQKVKILINGRGGTQRSVNKSDQNNFNQYVEQTIPLINAVNEITIFVANVHGKTISEPRIVKTSAYQAARSGTGFDLINYELKPNLYMLSIGVSEFANQDLNLNFADDDAISMTSIFEQQGKSIYNQVNMATLYNSDATRGNILEKFEWLKTNVEPQDVVIIFIASHGINEDGEFFIVPHDGSISDIRGSMVSWNDLSDVIGNLPSKVLMFLDACHSGQMGSNLSHSEAVDNTEALRTVSTDEFGVVIMSASTGSETAQEQSDWGHGAFTLSLIEGFQLGKADIRKDGVIFLRELDFYVSERTIELTSGQQHPTTQKPSTISRLPLFKIN